VKSWLYDTMYRFGAPWDGVGVREDLIELIKSGLVDPDRYPRSIDLGCGTGANVVYLAEQGFDSHGVDYSRIAIDKARARAADAGVDVGLVVGDLTARSLPGLEGSFDFLVDFGTLDDLRGRDRVAMARLATDLARPGACFLEWCFYGETATLPRFSFRGTSRFSHIAPGELDELFGDSWAVEPFSSDPRWRTACFLLTRR
jgi:SAM-dependent methyltransferase